MTGLATLYDYTRKAPYEDDLVERFVNIAEVKKALGVKESFVYEICSDVVGEALHGDVMKSVKQMVEYLVRKSRVLLYQGEYDLRDGVVQTEVWVKTMKWEGIEDKLPVKTPETEIKTRHYHYCDSFATFYFCSAT
ncbi:hypothetical protein VIGAN_01228300 [Vigna angularis var. angularis]|uniref:Uncharacterized protein n=2 Tax=Phaseolus angularis TaxID=3914 RepID=A0A0S3R1W8_PHAAN|nr:hypothetical protein VIGAN_01228300 [Vigna angularis var. angularis]